MFRLWKHSLCCYDKWPQSLLRPLLLTSLQAGPTGPLFHVRKAIIIVMLNQAPKSLGWLEVFWSEWILSGPSGPIMAIRFLLHFLFLDHLQFSTKLMLSHVDLLGVWKVNMTKDFRMGHEENVSQCLQVKVSPPPFWSSEMSWGIWMNWGCILADGFINHTFPSPLSALENRAPNDTKL